jgi:MoxR-like ATPase
MSESQATVEGERYPLPAPFMVIATENPVEFHGTYPLPEAQLDRFLCMLSLGYPSAESEVDILYAQADHHPLEDVRSVVKRQDIIRLQTLARHVRVERTVARYIVEIVGRTRSDPRLKLGVSPRGALMLFRASQVAAFAEGRNHVTPDDIQRLAVPVLAHRIMIAPKAKYEGVTKQGVIEELLRTVPAPA